MTATQQGFHWGTGRRKKSVARVRVREGTGRIVINGRPLKEYFVLAKAQAIVQEPLRDTKSLRKFDIWANIRGGGTSGQVGAFGDCAVGPLQERTPLASSLSSSSLVAGTASCTRGSGMGTLRWVIPQGHSCSAWWAQRP